MSMEDEAEVADSVHSTQSMLAASWDTSSSGEDELTPLTSARGSPHTDRDRELELGTHSKSDSACSELSLSLPESFEEPVLAKRAIPSQSQGLPVYLEVLDQAEADSTLAQLLYKV
jgi:hypothetical protein